MALTQAEKDELELLELEEQEAQYQAQKMPKKTREPFMGEGFVRGAVDALPAIGALGGGFLGTAAGPAGTVGGGMLGAAGGKALENLIEGTILGDEKTRDDIYMDPVRDAATEGLLMGAGGLVSKGAGLVGKYAKAPVTNILSRLSQPAKEGAEEIAAATQRIGAKPTKGMLTDQAMVQKMESSLAQTPTKAGQDIADQMTNIGESLKKSGQGIFEPSLTSSSPNQLASSARSSILKGIDTRLEPAVSVYKKIEKEVPHVPISPESTKRIANNISKLPYAQILGGEEAAFAGRINQNLEGVKNLGQLRNIKSYVGAISRDKSKGAPLRHTAGEILDKLNRLEQNSITRSVADVVKSSKGANSIAKEMIGEIKGANRLYGETSKELQEIAQQAGLGKVKNYRDFQNRLQDLSDEKFLNKMFTPGNERLMKSISKNFPEAFESMKQAKMVEFYNASLSKGEISIPKLINNLDRLSPEAKKMILGDAAEASLRDIKTVYNAIPHKVGPSGTPEGLAYSAFSPWNPKTWLAEAEAASKSYILNNPDKFKRFKSANPLNDMVEKSRPKSSNEVLRGRFKESTIPRGLMSPFNGEE